MAAPKVSKWEKNKIKNDLLELNITLMKYNLRVTLKNEKNKE